MTMMGQSVEPESPRSFSGLSIPRTSLLSQSCLLPAVNTTLTGMEGFTHALAPASEGALHLPCFLRLPFTRNPTRNLTPSPPRSTKFRILKLSVFVKLSPRTYPMRECLLMWGPQSRTLLISWLLIHKCRYNRRCLHRLHCFCSRWRTRTSSDFYVLCSRAVYAAAATKLPVLFIMKSIIQQLGWKVYNYLRSLSKVNLDANGVGSSVERAGCSTSPDISRLSTALPSSSPPFEGKCPLQPIQHRLPWLGLGE